MFLKRERGSFRLFVAHEIRQALSLQGRVLSAMRTHEIIAINCQVISKFVLKLMTRQVYWHSLCYFNIYRYGDGNMKYGKLFYKNTMRYRDFKELKLIFHRIKKFSQM